MESWLRKSALWSGRKNVLDFKFKADMQLGILPKVEWIALAI